jgi:hypothetical protein
MGPAGPAGPLGSAGPAGPAGQKGDKGDAGAAAAPGVRVVSSDAVSATCETGEVLVSAYCTGSWTSYPLKPAQNGASCGEAGSSEAKVTIVCMKR